MVYTPVHQNKILLKKTTEEEKPSKFKYRLWSSLPEKREAPMMGHLAKLK